LPDVLRVETALPRDVFQLARGEAVGFVHRINEVVEVGRHVDHLERRPDAPVVAPEHLRLPFPN